MWVDKSAVNRSTNPLADPPQACSVLYPIAHLAFASERQSERQLCRAGFLTADPCPTPSHLELVAQFPLGSFGPTGLLFSLALSSQAAGHLQNLLHSVFLHLSLFGLLQLCFHPCLNCDPSIMSISPWCVVLFRLIASPPLFFTASHTIFPFHCHRPTPAALPVLDRDVYLPSFTPLCHRGMSYQIMASRFFPGIHNLSCIAFLLSLVLLALQIIFSTWSNYMPFIVVLIFWLVS